MAKMVGSDIPEENIVNYSVDDEVTVADILIDCASSGDE